MPQPRSDFRSRRNERPWGEQEQYRLQQEHEINNDYK